MSESQLPLVEVRGVTKRFFHEGRELVILKPIDLRIERGEMLSIVGASGAGKSTLLHLLGTLDLPSEGQILYYLARTHRTTSSSPRPSRTRVTSMAQEAS